MIADIHRGTIKAEVLFILYSSLEVNPGIFIVARPLQKKFLVFWQIRWHSNGTGNLEARHGGIRKSGLPVLVNNCVIEKAPSMCL